jgi:hypothetical protein
MTVDASGGEQSFAGTLLEKRSFEASATKLK